MSSKRIAIFRNIGVGLIFLIGIVSCEKDLEDIAVDLTGQRPFDVGDSIFEVIAYHRNVDSSRVDNNDNDTTNTSVVVVIIAIIFIIVYMFIIISNTTIIIIVIIIIIIIILSYRFDLY